MSPTCNIVADCSHLPSSLPLGSSALPDAARRLLTSSSDQLRFNSLWNTVERNVRLLDFIPVS